MERHARENGAQISSSDQQSVSNGLHTIELKVDRKQASRIRSDYWTDLTAILVECARAVTAEIEEKVIARFEPGDCAFECAEDVVLCSRTVQQNCDIGRNVTLLQECLVQSSDVFTGTFERADGTLVLTDPGQHRIPLRVCGRQGRDQNQQE